MSLVFFAGRSSGRILDHLPHVAYTLLILNERELGKQKYPCLMQHEYMTRDGMIWKCAATRSSFKQSFRSNSCPLGRLQGRDSDIAMLFLAWQHVHMHASSSPKHSSIARNFRGADLFPSLSQLTRGKRSNQQHRATLLGQDRTTLFGLCHMLHVEVLVLIVTSAIISLLDAEC
jgi:hypothetical protein